MMSHSAVTVEPAAALRWFDDLAGDNSRAFWQARKDEYRRDVREPFGALLAAVDTALPSLGVSHGGWRVYRPHQDTRFTPGGDPLKTFIGAVAETGGGGGLFVQLERRGLVAASGMPYMAPDQVRTWREVVDDDVTGPEVADLVTGVREAGLRVTGGRPDPLKSAPKGYRADHPRIDLLRWKGVEALQWLGRDAWCDVDGRADAVLATWRAAAPLHGWLERHVGPSSMPRPGR